MDGEASCRCPACYIAKNADIGCNFGSVNAKAEVSIGVHYAVMFIKMSASASRRVRFWMMTFIMLSLNELFI